MKAILHFRNPVDARRCLGALYGLKKVKHYQNFNDRCSLAVITDEVDQEFYECAKVYNATVKVARNYYEV